MASNNALASVDLISPMNKHESPNLKEVLMTSSAGNSNSTDFDDLIIEVGLPDVFFVTTSGDNSNNGWTEETAWRLLNYSDDQVDAGDTVYVKKGTYDGDKIQPPNSGNETHPIKFIGYNETPGDIISDGYPNLTEAADMPLLTNLPATGLSSTYGGWANPPDYLEDGDDYLIGISAESGTIWDFSNAFFTIQTAQQNQPPKIDDGDFTFDKDCNPDPLTVCFTCTATDPDGDLSFYIFNLGDGILRFSEENTITYTYNNFGSYRTTCTAVDEWGNESPPAGRIVTLVNPNSELYGLFVGNHFEDGLRADLTAKDVSEKFHNLGKVRYNKLITDKWLPITQWEISWHLNKIKETIKPGDILVIYIAGHGRYYEQGENTDETTYYPGDEYVLLGESGLEYQKLTDDELVSYLGDIPDIEKWIIVDSCHSGGFWGNSFKRTGYDVVLIRGKAPIPVYLYISENEVKIEECSELWGKSVPHITDYFVNRFSKGVKVLGIGVAGEKRVTACASYA